MWLPFPPDLRQSYTPGLIHAYKPGLILLSGKYLEFFSTIWKFWRISR
ncbi:MAG: hypothetical protein ABIN24_01440 [Dyadobacter sp.]